MSHDGALSVVFVACADEDDAVAAAVDAYEDAGVTVSFGFGETHAIGFAQVAAVLGLRDVERVDGDDDDDVCFVAAAAAARVAAVALDAKKLARAIARQLDVDADVALVAAALDADADVKDAVTDAERVAWLAARFVAVCKDAADEEVGVAVLWRLTS